MKTTQVFLMLATICLVVIAGCIHRPSPNINNDESTIAKATADIDAGHYETAVKNLEGYLFTEPQDARARMLLSNAYIRWSGIKFNDFIPLARFYLDQSEKKDSFAGGDDSLIRALRKAQPVTLAPVADALADFEKLLTTLEALADAFNLIPELTEDQYVHFRQGLDQAILAQSPKKGDVLYLVVLRVVDLKFNWTHRDNFKFMNKQCAVVPQGLSDFLDRTRHDYETITDGLTFVYPDLGAELAGNLQKFDGFNAQIQKKLGDAFGRNSSAVVDPQNLKSVWECL